MDKNGGCSRQILSSLLITIIHSDWAALCFVYLVPAPQNVTSIFYSTTGAVWENEILIKTASQSDWSFENIILSACEKLRGKIVNRY